MKLLTPISLIFLAEAISVVVSCKTAYQIAEDKSSKNYELAKDDTLSIIERLHNRYNFVVNEPDTVIAISGDNVTYSFVHLDGFNYSLDLFEDDSIYELSISLNPGPYSDAVIIRTISWGDYKTRGKRILFSDRIAGFKMEATVEPGVGMKFHKDYFPDLNKKDWNILQSGGNMFDFLAIFDKKKAARYRKAYGKKYPEPIKFTPGNYGPSLEIGEDGRWTQKYGDLLLAEGRWHRKRNILVLNCPKLGCNFYMTIGEKRLTSMLLLMDIWGTYYYTPAEFDKFLPGFRMPEKDDLYQ